jgi:hypothetical protein
VQLSAEFKVLEPGLEIRPEAIQATLQEISRTDPRALKVSAQQLIDRRFLKEIEQDGTLSGSRTDVRGLTFQVRSSTSSPAPPTRNLER